MQYVKFRGFAPSDRTPKRLSLAPPAIHYRPIIVRLEGFAEYGYNCPDRSRRYLISGRIRCYHSWFRQIAGGNGRYHT